MNAYRLLIEPEVHDARVHLPGHVRQRIKRAMTDLASDPRLPGSTLLDVGDLDVPKGVELRRLRLEHWRSSTRSTTSRSGCGFWPCTSGRPIPMRTWPN